MNISDKIEDALNRAKLQGIPFDGLELNPRNVWLMEEEYKKQSRMTGTITMLKFKDLRLIKNDDMPENKIVFLLGKKKVYQALVLSQIS